MSNLLAIPFKRYSAIDIRDPVRNYIQNNTGTHPDEFKSDIARWLVLRRDALGTAVHVNAVDPILLSVPRCSLSPISHHPVLDPTGHLLCPRLCTHQCTYHSQQPRF